MSSSSEIKVIVKSPAQKTEDQTINCNLDWTISKLKTYISENFPFKPAINDQRLIYSGHLLKDEKTLKEIFQPTEQDNSTFTVHLVFCPKTNTNEESKVSKDSKDKNNVSNENNGSANNAPTINQPPNISQFSFNLTNDSSIDFANIYVQQMQQYQQMYVSYMTQFLANQNSNLDQPSQPPFTNMYNTMMNPIFFNPILTVPNLATTTDFSPFSLNTSNNNNNNLNATTTTTANSSTNTENGSTSDSMDNNRAANDQAQNNNDLNDDAQNGWLDLINIFWNILILLSVVSASITRTLFVVCICFIYYHYQSGFFSRLRIRLFGTDLRPTNQNNNNNNPPNNEEQLQEMMDNDIPDGLRRRNVQPTTQNQSNAENTDINNNEQEQNNFVLSKFRFFWMVITSLFSSLMPHNGPEIPAN